MEFRWRTRIIFTVCLVLTAGCALAQTTNSGIVAEVNGQPITQQEFYARLQLVTGSDFIASTNPLLFKNVTAGQLVMMMLINQQLVLQYAAKTDLLPKDTDVASEMQALEKEPNISHALSSGIMTDAMLKTEIEYQRAVYNIATINVNVTPTEVQDYYNQHLADYTPPDQWTLSIIRVNSQTKLDQVEKALKAGQDFAAVAKQYSDDPSTRDSGGAFGTVPSNDPQIPVPLRAAITKLSAGQYTDPVAMQTIPARTNQPPQTIWFIAKLTDLKKGAPPSFDTIKGTVERQALFAKAGGVDAATKKIATFEKQSSVKILLPGYQDLLSQPAAPATK